jgi:16S rRNA (guanine(527)-N(7))-methyltransferase RsmG
MINYDLLESELNKIGVKLDSYGYDRFDQYADRLISWNKHVNLTAITEPDDIVIKHFVDCLNIMRYVNFTSGQTLIDVGCGAGFPGLPLLIANPEIEVTFIDSIKKKLAFIKDTLNNAGLIANLRHKRAEELSREDDYREKFDYATARAVAPLNILAEYCLPFVKVGGLFIAMKGSSGKEELDNAQNAITTLGGELATFAEFELSNGDKRSIIIIKKISQTPTKYPRKSKKIDTKPL